MKKRYIRTIYVVIAMLMLTACNNSEVPDSTEQTLTTAADTTAMTEITSVATEDVTTAETTIDLGLIPNTAGIVIRESDTSAEGQEAAQVSASERGVNGARKVGNSAYQFGKYDISKFGVTKKLVFQCIDSITVGCDFAIFDRFNELLVNKYGCDFVVEFIGVSDMTPKNGYTYAERMVDTRRLGQQADIITALDPSYSALVEEGYFIELTDYLKNTDEGRKFYDAYPEEIWDMVTIDEKIYGYTTFSTPLSIFVLNCNKSMAEKCGLKVEEGFSFYDIGRILEEADIPKEELGKLAPIRADSGYLLTDMGYFDVGRGVYMRKDAGGAWTAFNATEDEEIIKLWKLLREYKEKGWLATGRAADALVQHGNYIFSTDITKDAEAVGDKILRITEREKKTVYDIIVGDTEYFNYGPRNTLVYGISSWSEYPDEALKLITLMQTEPELCNLLRYGIEGTHYIYEDNEVKKRWGNGEGTGSGVIQIVNPNLTYPVDLEPDNKLEFYKDICSNYEKDPRLDCGVTTDEYFELVLGYDNKSILHQIYEQGYTKLYDGEYEDVDAAVAEINRMQKENGIDGLIDLLNEMFRKQ